MITQSTHIKDFIEPSNIVTIQSTDHYGKHSKMRICFTKVLIQHSCGASASDLHIILIIAALINSMLAFVLEGTYCLEGSSCPSAMQTTPDLINALSLM